MLHRRVRTAGDRVHTTGIFDLLPTRSFALQKAPRAPGITLYDFSNIRHEYGPDDYVIAGVELYLDFINLFWALLRILLILTGNGRSRD